MRQLAFKGRHRGFSLIEILVVVVIIGLLVGIIGPVVFGRVEEARIQKVRADFKALQTALKLYKLDNFQYPTTDQGLQALVTQPTQAPVPRGWKAGGYVETLNQDPWGRPYLYMSPAEGHEYDIYTLGADGVTGGEGEAADMSVWQQADKEKAQ